MLLDHGCHLLPVPRSCTRSRPLIAADLSTHSSSAAATLQSVSTQEMVQSSNTGCCQFLRAETEVKLSMVCQLCSSCPRTQLQQPKRMQLNYYLPWLLHPLLVAQHAVITQTGPTLSLSAQAQAPSAFTAARQLAQRRAPWMPGGWQPAWQPRQRSPPWTALSAASYQRSCSRSF